MQIIHEARVWGLELQGDLAPGVRTQQQHKPSDDRTQPGPQGQYTVAIQLSRWQVTTTSQAPGFGADSSGSAALVMVSQSHKLELRLAGQPE